MDKKISYFTSITMYDKKYKTQNKNMCSFFALVTAENFMTGSDITNVKHEQNIDEAVAYYEELQMKGAIQFEELINFTDLKKQDICATTTELIKLGEIGYDKIFLEYKGDYCIVFLKNSKYFVVMYRNNVYYLRDCHEDKQYNFKDRNDLVDHLNKSYQFNEIINIDGYVIPEFSNIEYITITSPFFLGFKNYNINKPDLKLLMPPDDKLDNHDPDYGDLVVSPLNSDYNELHEIDEIIEQYKQGSNHNPPQWFEHEANYYYYDDDDNN